MLQYVHNLSYLTNSHHEVSAGLSYCADRNHKTYFFTGFKYCSFFSNKTSMFKKKVLFLTLLVYGRGCGIWVPKRRIFDEWALSFQSEFRILQKILNCSQNTQNMIYRNNFAKFSNEKFIYCARFIHKHRPRNQFLVTSWRMVIASLYNLINCGPLQAPNASSFPCP